jgi:hypothetical protein
VKRAIKLKASEKTSKARIFVDKDELYGYIGKERVDPFIASYSPVVGNLFDTTHAQEHPISFKSCFF